MGEVCGKCSSTQRSAWSSQSTKTNTSKDQLHGHTLKVVDSGKYLRVNISHDLSWHTHVDAIAQQVYKGGQANSLHKAHEAHPRVCFSCIVTGPQIRVTENYFLISQPKHMLWVLKRTVYMRGFKLSTQNTCLN